MARSCIVREAVLDREYRVSPPERWESGPPPRPRARRSRRRRKSGIYLKKRLAEIFAENTGKDLKQVEKDMDRDNWMSAEEAKAYGIVDEVIDK